MLNLLAVDEAGLERLLREPGRGLREICSNGSEIEDFLLPMLRQSLDFHRRIGSVPPWQSYLAVESPTKLLVGICSFKGNPTEAGEVEISYGTVPGFEGRGCATGMARGLMEIAFRSPAIRRVIAYTMPERNASGRVLQKVGMVNVGEVMDPEDGKIWRWEINRPEA